jgi:hypothetical protein
MVFSWRAEFACILLVLLAAGQVRAETVTVALDRWMYPFAFTGGTRNLSPTFGAVGTAGFDNRDGQFVIGFDTSGVAPRGLGASLYQINSVTVRTMVGSPAGFPYDPSYDSFRTLLPNTDPDYLNDVDAGRPIELHGVGFRNGYTQLSFSANDNQPPGFEESTSFGTQGVGTRNAYPLAFLTAGAGSDIANNVDNRTESNPWAIGTTTLAPGAVVPDNSTFAFQIDVLNADVQNYLQRGLNDGVLGFAITSFHEASQGGGGPPAPQFVTRENTGGGTAPAVLEIDFQIVPEPATIALASVGAVIAVLPCLRRRRTR